MFPAASRPLRTVPLLALLAACSAPLPYQALPPPLATEAQTVLRARSLDDPALAVFLASAGVAVPAPGSAWTAAQLAWAASWASPEVALADAQWRQSIAQARLDLVPGPVLLDASVDHHSQLAGQRPSPWTLGLGFELTLPDPARRSARAAIGEEGVQAARLALADAAWTVRQQALLACVVLEMARARQILQQQQVLLTRAATGIVAARLDAGVVSPADLREGQLALTDALQAAAEAHEDEERASAALRDRLGLAPGRPVPLALPALPHDRPAPGGDGARAPVAVVQGWLSAARQALAAQAALASVEGLADPSELARRALDNRLDLRQAEAQYRRADALLRLAVAQQYPEWSVHPGYEWDQGDHRLRLGLALPVALPQAHAAAVGFAEAERTTQGRRLLAAQQGVLQGVEQAREGLLDARLRVAQRAALLDQRLEQFAALQADLDGRQIDPLDLVQAALAALPLQRRWLEALEESARASLQLEQQLQQPGARTGP